MIILLWLIGVSGAVAMVAYDAPVFAVFILTSSFVLSLFIMVTTRQVRDYEGAMQRLKKINETLDSLEAMPVKRQTFPASKVGKG